MGWLKLGARTTSKTPESQFQEELKYTTQHIETVSISPSREKPRLPSYPKVPLSVPDSELPFILCEEVIKRKSAETGALFIVVDEIVYDCTDFIREHPGGTQIIESFAGAECSWQFWRFHGKVEMEEFGRPLRVGRTNGLRNKFEEPKKYVGLRRLGDDWD